MRKLLITCTFLVTLLSSASFAFTSNNNPAFDGGRSAVATACAVEQNISQGLMRYQIINGEDAPAGEFNQKVSPSSIFASITTKENGIITILFSYNAATPKFMQGKAISCIPYVSEDGTVIYPATQCVSDIRNDDTTAGLQNTTRPYNYLTLFEGSLCGRTYYVPSDDILSLTSAELHSRIARSSNSRSSSHGID